MYTLGVNGWFRGSHDPAAALFRNGELIAAAEEERFTRRKHAFDTPPLCAVEYCLATAGITAGDIDHLAVGWDMNALLSQEIGTSVSTSPGMVLDIFLPLAFFPERRGRTIEIHLVNHHVAHAAYAFAASPFDAATVVVADGSGELTSTSIALGRRGQPIKVLRSYAFAESLGIFYEALTKFIGFGGFQEGRTMGLAAFGTPRYALGRPLDFDASPAEQQPFKKEDFVLAGWLKHFEAVTGNAAFHPRRSYRMERGIKQPELELSQCQKDLAASGQLWVEQQLCRLVAFAVGESGNPNVVLGGGVALNCPANQAVTQLPEVQTTFVPPAPGDTGVALGGACAALSTLGVAVRLDRRHVYRGPSFPTEVVRDELVRTGVTFVERVEIERDIARAIAMGRIVAVFQGGMELGPRALGHRSILADPRSTALRDRVNRIKARELWRPLAPCVRAQAAEQWLERADSPFMSYSVRAKDSAREQIPGVLHHDGTARLQTVGPADDEQLSRLLDAGKRRLGFRWC